MGRREEQAEQEGRGTEGTACSWLRGRWEDKVSGWGGGGREQAK